MKVKEITKSCPGILLSKDLVLAPAHCMLLDGDRYAQQSFPDVEIHIDITHNKTVASKKVIIHGSFASVRKH